MNDRTIKLTIVKAMLLRWHIGIVVAIQIANIPALWLRYVAVNVKGQDIFVSFFSVSSEGKLGTFFSGVVLLVCALFLAVIAYAKLQNLEPYRALWALLSLIFLYIAFDEVTAVHERIGPIIGDMLGSWGLLRGWVVPGIICVTLIGFAYIRFIIDLPKRSRLLFVAAGALYVFGALGMEIVGIWYMRSNVTADLGYGILATIEEIFEMSGLVVFLYALLDYLERTINRVVVVSFR